MLVKAAKRTNDPDARRRRVFTDQLQLEHCAGVTGPTLVANSVNAAFTRAAAR
jgi:hypothetical protein